MASADALTDAGLSADVSAAVAFARSSLDAYENDRRYAAVVHEAVDAGTTRFGGVKFGALARARRARRHASRGFGRAQGRARPRVALRPGVEPARVPSGRRYVTARDVLRRGRARLGAGGSRRTRRAPNAFVCSLEAFSAFETTTLFLRGRLFRRRCLLRRRRCLLLRRPLLPGRPRSVRRFVREDRVAYADAGMVGGFMQALTFVYSSKHYESPALIDDWMRCSTLARPCSISETLRRCTYEPKLSRGTASGGRAGTRRWTGRTGAEDLAEVYEYCTDFERQSGCATRASRGAGRCSSARGRRSTPDRPRGTGNSVGFRGRAWCTGKHGA